MVDRWTVERAVRHELCTLDPPGRQLVLTLLTWSDAATAVIPERFTPSLTDLQKATGLARSSIAKWLNVLEGRGGRGGEERPEQKWVWRERPTVADARRRKARTVYRLGVPSELLRRLTELGVVGPRAGPGRSESPNLPALAGPARGPVKAGSGPHRGLELVRQAERVSPPHGRKTYRKHEPGGHRANGDHRYVEGPNGRCAHPGCNRSAPLHGPSLQAVPKQERSVIGGMSRHHPPVDDAQCETCGGELIAAGDDWLHQVQGDCTELGTPVICRGADCGMPAAVGSEVCLGCADAFSSPNGVRVRS